MNRSNSANGSIPTPNPYTRIEFRSGIDLLDQIDLLAEERSTPDVGSRPDRQALRHPTPAEREALMRERAAKEASRV